MERAWSLNYDNKCNYSTHPLVIEDERAKENNGFCMNML
jgi:hypothetical protein